MLKCETVIVIQPGVKIDEYFKLQKLFCVIQTEIDFSVSRVAWREILKDEVYPDLFKN